MIPIVWVAVMSVVGARENRSEIVVIVGDVATAPPNHVVLLVEWYLECTPSFWCNMR